VQYAKNVFGKRVYPNLEYIFPQMFRDFRRSFAKNNRMLTYA